MSASVMKAEAQVKRRRQAQHLDRWHWRSSGGGRDLRLWEVLVVTGQAGHTIKVQPWQDAPYKFYYQPVGEKAGHTIDVQPPPPPNFF